MDKYALMLEQKPIADERRNRTLVPLRLAAETPGNAILWDGKRRKSTILKK